MEVDAGILSMVEEVFSGGNETRVKTKELWNDVLLPTGCTKIIKLLRTASGNTNKRKKRASADGVGSNDGGSLISREVNDVDMGVDGIEGAGKFLLLYVVDLVWFSLDCFLRYYSN